MNDLLICQRQRFREGAPTKEVTFRVSASLRCELISEYLIRTGRHGDVMKFNRFHQRQIGRSNIGPRNFRPAEYKNNRSKGINVGCSGPACQGFMSRSDGYGHPILIKGNRKWDGYDALLRTIAPKRQIKTTKLKKNSSFVSALLFPISYESPCVQSGTKFI